MKIAQVACGWQHTLALTEEGRVYSWVIKFLSIMLILKYRDLVLMVN